MSLSLVILPTPSQIDEINKHVFPLNFNSSWQKVSPVNMHLTICQLDSLQDVSLDKASMLLNETLHFDQIKTVSWNNPKTVWLKAKSNPVLQKISEEYHLLNDRRKSNQKFTPHITVARTKDGRNANIIQRDINFHFKIERVALIKSVYNRQVRNFNILKELYIH